VRRTPWWQAASGRAGSVRRTLVNVWNLAAKLNDYALIQPSRQVFLRKIYVLRIFSAEKFAGFAKTHYLCIAIQE